MMKTNQPSSSSTLNSGAAVLSGQAFHFKSAGSDSVNLLHAGLDISARLTESLSVNGRWEYASSVGGVSDHGNNGLLSLAYEF